MQAPVPLRETTGNRDSFFCFQAGNCQRIFYKRWKEVGRVKAIIVYISGLGQSVESSDSFLSQFCDKGFRVYSMDIRGHGNTAKMNPKSILDEAVIDDMEHFMEEIDLPVETPKFLMGSNIGALIALRYYLESKNIDKFNGLVLIAPSFRLILPKSKLFAIKFFKGIIPSKKISMGVTFDQLSNDPAFLEKCRQENLVNDSFSAKTLGWAMKEGTTMLSSKDIQVDIPVLIFIGAEDTIVDNQATETFFKQLECSEKQLIKVPGGKHLLHYDSAKEDLFKSILDWINEKSQNFEI